MMRSVFFFILILSATGCASMHQPAAVDQREFVKMPKAMQQHMLGNMRDHLLALNEILTYLSTDELDQAADVAEHRLGMSSLDNHGAEHMGKLMPAAMAQAGTEMHRAASRFALKAQEGDALEAYAAINDITAACVACHAGFRIH